MTQKRKRKIAPRNRLKWQGDFWHERVPFMFAEIEDPTKSSIRNLGKMFVIC